LNRIGRFSTRRRRDLLRVDGSGKLTDCPVWRGSSVLAKRDIRRCVVTNSLSNDFLIRSQLPIPQNHSPLGHTVDYAHASRALDVSHGHRTVWKKGDKIIGFEDRVRGLQRLQGPPLSPILICPSTPPSPCNHRLGKNTPSLRSLRPRADGH